MHSQQLFTVLDHESCWKHQRLSAEKALAEEDAARMPSRMIFLPSGLLGNQEENKQDRKRR